MPNSDAYLDLSKSTAARAVLKRMGVPTKLANNGEVVVAPQGRDAFIIPENTSVAYEDAFEPVWKEQVRKFRVPYIITGIASLLLIAVPFTAGPMVLAALVGFMAATGVWAFVAVEAYAPPHRMLRDDEIFRELALSAVTIDNEVAQALLREESDELADAVIYALRLVNKSSDEDASLPEARELIETYRARHRDRQEREQRAVSEETRRKLEQTIRTINPSRPFREASSAPSDNV